MSERIEELHAALESGVAALTGSKEWADWLTVAATFHKYSFSNQMLIALQCPDATHVAGYRAWQALGRQVRKGEKSIGILAPSTRKVKDDSGNEERRIVGFRAASVFDVSQTDGDPLPVQPLPVLLAGAAPVGLWDAVAAIITGQGYAIERGDCNGANGVTRPASRTVRVRADVSDAQAVKTLAHECAHVLLHTADASLIPMHRGVMEVEAESVSFIVASAHGMTTDAYSLPYVAGWSDGKASMVSATAARVVATAKDILKATGAPTE